MGDSKLIIDWANGRSHIENLVLILTINMISEVRMKFAEIIYFHAYGEFNEHIV